MSDGYSLHGFTLDFYDEGVLTKWQDEVEDWYLDIPPIPPPLALQVATGKLVVDCGGARHTFRTHCPACGLALGFACTCHITN